MNWISVEDRLPINEDYVLACGYRWDVEDDELRIVGEVYFDLDEKIWVLAGCCRENLKKVTHWMPLPKDPDGT